MLAAFLPTGNSRVFKDIGSRLEFKQIQTLCVLGAGMIPTCLCESPWFFVPFTILYQSVLSFDLVADYFEISGQEDHIQFVLQNKLPTIIKLILITQFIQYSFLLLILYFKTKFNLTLMQLTVAKESVKVIVK